MQYATQNCVLALQGATRPDPSLAEPTRWIGICTINGLVYLGLYTCVKLLTENQRDCFIVISA